MPDQSQRREIAQTIITMGKSLGLTVIAEGVETAAQHLFLEERGCHAFQGYLYSRPLPLNEFMSLINERMVKV